MYDVAHRPCAIRQKTGAPLMTSVTFASACGHVTPGASLITGLPRLRVRRGRRGGGGVEGLEGLSDEALFGVNPKLLERLFDEDGNRIPDITIKLPSFKVAREFDKFGRPDE